MSGQVQTLDWTITPPQALARWPASRPVVMLHSGRFDARWSRRSILAEPAGWYRFGAALPQGHARSLWLGPPPAFELPRFTHDPFNDLKHLLASSQSARPQGLWIGYLSYDLGRSVENMPTTAADDRNWPAVELAWCPSLLVHDMDGQTQTWQTIGDSPAASLLEALSEAPSAANAQTISAQKPRSVFGPRHHYEKAVDCCLDYIGAGDVFQINLAQRLTAPFEGRFPGTGRALYLRLAEGSPAWYGAYLELPTADREHPRAIASTSPELFLRLTPDGHVVSRPIKGTRPADVGPSELLHSPKDMAELHMITDLVRNDLGRVCAYGSVRVTEPRVVESHPTVHQAVSTVRGGLAPGKDTVDLIRACFPPGSVTGAPKVRAMQIIEELEPVRRGPYCGAIGAIRADELHLSVAIRTMLLRWADANRGEVDLSVGGGVVADSTAAQEYQETIDKAQAMLRALGIDSPDNP
ncbi:MAG: anthranilate synthase component I family protein [Phycisphaeraceae bacterium]|nr:anthranilate synthase component I family protein [Phycisphaeraceae bacterium]